MRLKIVTWPSAYSTTGGYSAKRSTSLPKKDRKTLASERFNKKSSLGVVIV